MPFGWVAADEAYGDNRPLRTWLEDRRIRYVLAVACNHRAPAGAVHTVRGEVPSLRPAAA